MSLNKFTNVDIGQEIDLAIGCDVIEANSLSVGAIAVDDIAPIAPATKIDIEGDFDMKTNDILNATNITVGSIDPIAPATDIEVEGDLDMKTNDILNATNITVGSIDPIAPATDIEVEGNLDMKTNDILNATNITVGSIDPIAPATDIEVEGDLDMKDNKILNTTEITSSTQVNMPQPLDMVGNSINGVAEVRGFSGNPLPLTTFADGTGIVIEELGDVKFQKDINMDGKLIKNVFSISNDTDGEVLIQGTSGVDALLVGDGNITSSAPLTISTNGKTSLIDNDFNTLDASSGFSCNVNTGGSHSFTINNQQKFDIEPFVNTSRNPIKLLNQPLQFDISANIQTTNTQNLNIDLDGEFLDIKSDTAVDNALEFTTSMGNFSFNRNVKAPSIQALTGDLVVNSNLDMNSNNIVNVPAVKSDGDLSLENATGPSEGILIEDGGEILIKQDTAFQNFNVRSVNDLQTQTAKCNDATNITFPLSMTPNGAFQVLGGVYIVKDLQVNGEIFCDTINNIRPSGGVYSESDGYTLAGDGGTLERPILNQGTSYGSLAVPAGGWTPGDTFAFKAGGQITCNNNATFTLRVCSNFTAGGGGLNEADFASIDIEVDGAQTADWWELEVEFICRAVGAAGVAAISTNGHYSYFSSTDFQKGYGINNTNNTTFNTTVDNDLQIGFFSNESSAALSSFQIDQVSLTKLY